MKFINATPGEMAYDFLKRALLCASSENMVVIATHNNIPTTVYPESCMPDLTDKFHMARKLEKLERIAK
jgi:hypothetical protein